MVLYDILSIVDINKEVEIFDVDSMDTPVSYDDVPLTWLHKPVALISEKDHKIQIYVLASPTFFDIILPDGQPAELFTDDVASGFNLIYEPPTELM